MSFPATRIFSAVLVAGFLVMTMTGCFVPQDFYNTKVKMSSRPNNPDNKKDGKNSYLAFSGGKKGAVGQAWIDSPFGYKPDFKFELQAGFFSPKLNYIDSIGGFVCLKTYVIDSPTFDEICATYTLSPSIGYEISAYDDQSGFLDSAFIPGVMGAYIALDSTSSTTKFQYKAKAGDSWSDLATNSFNDSITDLRWVGTYTEIPPGKAEIGIDNVRADFNPPAYGDGEGNPDFDYAAGQLVAALDFAWKACLASEEFGPFQYSAVSIALSGSLNYLGSSMNTLEYYVMRDSSSGLQGTKAQQKLAKKMYKAAEKAHKTVAKAQQGINVSDEKKQKKAAGKGSQKAIKSISKGLAAYAISDEFDYDFGY